MRILVVCPDYVIRHESFDSYGKAVQWAAWGHACLHESVHVFEDISDAWVDRDGEHVPYDRLDHRDVECLELAYCPIPTHAAGE